MSMKNKLSGGVALLIAVFSLNEVKAQTCAVPPTCAQLGYTMKKADCGENPVLRCPFALTDDNQVYCGETTETESIVDVAVGAILYGDGTVSRGIISGKTPIGIVFDVENRLAVALTDIRQNGSEGTENMYWSDKKYYDIPNLENCTDMSGEIAKVCGVDGRSNTDKILACGDSCGRTPAATACNLYQPTGCTKDFCKKGKWFLPSQRDFYNIYQNNKLINTMLSSLGKGRFSDESYWTSTEEDMINVWVFDVSDIAILWIHGYKGETLLPVRPVVKF